MKRYSDAPLSVMNFLFYRVMDLIVPLVLGEEYHKRLDEELSIEDENLI